MVSSLEGLSKPAVEHSEIKMPGPIQTYQTRVSGTSYFNKLPGDPDALGCNQIVDPI